MYPLKGWGRGARGAVKQGGWPGEGGRQEEDVYVEREGVGGKELSMYAHQENHPGVGKKWLSSCSP